MQFTAIVALLFAGVAVAQGGICFDDFDCIGQGSCVKSGAIAITGTCSGSSGSSTGSIPGLPSGISIPSFGLKDREAEAEAQE